MAGSPVDGRRGVRVFVGVGGRAVWAFSPLAVAAAATFVFAAAVAIWAVLRLEVTAAAAYLSVCGEVRFEWILCCRSPWWPCW